MGPSNPLPSVRVPPKQASWPSCCGEADHCGHACERGWHPDQLVARSYLVWWLLPTGRWNQVLGCLAVGAGKAGAEPFVRQGWVLACLAAQPWGSWDWF